MDNYVLNNKTTFIRKNKNSIGNYKEFENILYEGNSIIEHSFFKNIIESIRILNPNFYLYLLSKKKIEKKEIITLWKYVMRSMSRATPLGDLSSVCFLENKDERKTFFFDIDSEWMIKVLKEYKNLKSIDNIEKIYFYKNGSVLLFRDYLLIYSKESEKIEAIKSNVSINTILNELENGKKLEEIIKLMNGKYNMNLSKKEVIDILIDLSSKKLINWDISKNFNNSFNFMILEEYIKIIKFDNENKEKILKIIYKLKELNKEYNFEKLNNLMKIMKEIHIGKNYINLLSTELMEKNEKKELKQLSKEVLKLNNIFSRLLLYMPENNYKNSVKNFILEKYGKNSFVPFSEILTIINETKIIDEYDEIFNLPFFKILFSKFSTELKYAEFNSKNYDLKKSKLIENCILEMDKEIDKNTILKNDTEFLFESGIDENLNLIDIRLSSQIGSNSSGKLIGRFLRNSKELSIKDKFEEYKRNNILLVSITNGFSDYIVYNVLPKYEKNEEFEIILNTLPSNNKSNLININDIYIYIDDRNKICLFSKKYSKELKIINHHAVNAELGNKLYRTLEYISKENSIIDILYYMKKFYENQRIQTKVYFGDILLFEPIFRLELALYLKYENKESFFLDLIKILNKKNIVTEGFTHMSVEDQGMIINLNNKYHREIVLLELIKKKEIEFKSVPKSYSDAIKNNNKNFYNCELVLSIEQKKINIDNKKNKFFPLFYNSSSELKTINDEVIYLKIFVNRKFEIDTLLKIYTIFNNKFINKEKFHFVRYKEQEEHIRFRIFVNNSTIKQNKIFEFINSLYNIKEINRIEIVPYFREKIRYGEKIFNYYEEYSKSESELIVHSLIFLEKNIKNRDERDIFAYKFLLDIVEIFELKKEFINFHKEIKGYMIENVKKFQKEKLNIINRLNLEFLEILNSNKNFSKIYFDWKEKLIKYNRMINLNEEYNKIEIMRSVIHMLLNRFYGIDRKKEELILKEVSIIADYYLHLNIKKG